MIFDYLQNTSPYFVNKFSLTKEFVEDLYNQFLSDVEELKKKFNLEMVKLNNGTFFRYELELFKRWNAIKVKNNYLIVLADRVIPRKTHQEPAVFNYVILTHFLNYYRSQVQFAREQEEIEKYGSEEAEKRKQERFNKIRESVRRILNKDSEEEVVPKESSIGEIKIVK